jgi:hypothetical protein
VAFASCALAILCFAVAPLEAQTPPKIWSIDLSVDPDFQKRLKYTDSWSSLAPPTIDFIGQGKLVVSFTDGVRSVPTLADPNMRPFGFHVLEIDGTVGKRGKRLDFGVLNDSCQAMAIADGDFVLLAGEELKKFSGSLVETSSIPIPLVLHGQPTKTEIGGKPYLNPRYEWCRFDVAPGGKTLVLANARNPQSMQLQ